MWSRSAGLLQRRPAGSTFTKTATTVHQNLLAAAETFLPIPLSTRSYVSRAHPKPIPEFAVPTAMQMVLDDIEQRKVARAERWEGSKEQRLKKGVQDSGPYRNHDETVELAINLNVDPRRPGQALRGSLMLPHGTGSTVSCLIFTSDPAVIEKATEAGHKAGGEELIDGILQGTEPIDAYQRAMATKDILPQVQKQLARLLGPRGLMPNPKTNTIFDSGDALLTSLNEVANTITYRTDASGILHFKLGKGSFTSDQLIDNMQTICQTVQQIKPESYGKGKKQGGSGGGGGGKKKMGKNVKYWLRAHLTATQGKGSVRMDLRSVDPTSPFFMKEPE